jgi:hypothetical protein
MRLDLARPAFAERRAPYGRAPTDASKSVDSRTWQESSRSGRTSGLMDEPTAQRTLVKSPPELWAEISDVQALARHLGEFGEIRITRLEPETTVAWEGDTASGTVELEPAGWGTKVTLTAVPAAPEQQLDPQPEADAVAEAEPEPEAEPVLEPEPEHTAAVEPDAIVEPEPASLAPPAAEPEPQPQPEPAPAAAAKRRRSPIAWLRYWLGSPVPEAAGREAACPEAAGPEPVPGPDPAPLPEPVPEPVPDPAPPLPPAATTEPAPVAIAEHAAIAAPVVGAAPEPEAPAVVEPEAAAPGIDADRTLAILTSVLDDLGSAHHRPFSR